MDTKVAVLSSLKSCLRVVAITIICVKSASAALITYDVSIGTADSNDPVFQGIAVVNTDSHVLLPGNGFTLGHIYDLTYELQSTQGALTYSGVGTLKLATLLDLYVNFDGFKRYMTEGPEPIIDPPSSGWVWHEADFDLATLKRLSANEMTTSHRTGLTMQQVPEPSMLALSITGLIGFLIARRSTRSVLGSQSPRSVS